MTSSPPPPIPVLLLKTRSQPHDAYEEYFSAQGTTASSPAPTFQPEFVPVLKHRPNTTNLDRLVRLLKTGQLPSQYGGMIFTSQRAVEGWASVVKTVEIELEQEHGHRRQVQAEAASGMVCLSSIPTTYLHVTSTDRQSTTQT